MKIDLEKIKRLPPDVKKRVHENLSSIQRKEKRSWYKKRLYEVCKTRVARLC